MSKLTDDQIDFIGELLAAEASYLRSFNWIPIAPIVPGAPVFWRDPMGDDERSQDVAVVTQKLRVNSIIKQEINESFNRD